jgi:hypothetical protein
MAEDFGVFVQLANWIKSELIEDKEALFYNLIGNSEAIDTL